MGRGVGVHKGHCQVYNHSRHSSVAVEDASIKILTFSIPISNLKNSEELRQCITIMLLCIQGMEIKCFKIQWEAFGLSLTTHVKWNLAVSTTYLIPPTNRFTEVNIYKVLKRSNDSSRKNWFHKLYSINHYLLGAVVGKWLKIWSVCKNILFQHQTSSCTSSMCL